jgi:hypothetical protein
MSTKQTNVSDAIEFEKFMFWIPVFFEFEVSGDEVFIKSINVAKTAPKGTGTNFMKKIIDVCRVFECNVRLEVAGHGARPTEDKNFKSNSSRQRLRRFYSRLGFQDGPGQNEMILTFK